jgi:TRAP-type mannitol/chloroaromatic compound transport system permease large subunit
MVFTYTGGDIIVEEFMVGLPGDKWGFIILSMVSIMIIGFFIDFIEITFIIVPVVAPIFIHLQIDLLWIGILIAVNLQTSFLTPPFGFSLFYLKGVAPQGITTNHIYKGIIPYVIIQLIGLLLLVLFPQLALWLPKFIGH